MQIKKQDTKEDLIELIPETLDDLWHISHIIQPDDEVSTLTTRRIQDNNSGKTRSDRGIKKTFYLQIKVEKINFHRYTGMLRLTGIITQGPEDLIPLGSHHTINVQLNQALRIYKKWNKWSLDRLNEAIKASKRATEIIVAIEDNETTLGIIKQYGIDYIGPIIGDISGKRTIQKNRKEKINEYYKQITDTINQHKDINKLIIIGPGFTKNSYYEYLHNHNPELASKSTLESTGAGGHSGIQEVLKNGLIENLSQNAKIAKETGAVNKLLEQIAKNSSQITYGENQTRIAANMGAVEQLLILDINIRDENIQQIMNIVENMGGNILIISSEHDAGVQLESLGGIGAFLRYSI